MINNFVFEDLTLIKQFYEQAFRALNDQSKLPDIEITFYPYVGINHTIRVRDGRVLVRLAEISKSAEPNVQHALAYILVSKLLRKKVPARANEIYRSFVKSHDIQTKAIENRRAKGRKIITTAQGAIYDLNFIFARLNKTYFQNALDKPILSWSARKTYRILGHHDATHKTIIISQSLDDQKVPEYVVEYVVYHEMLHIFHPTMHRNGRRYNHTPEFRRDEQRFIYFEQAEKWIAENAGRIKRRVLKNK